MTDSNLGDYLDSVSNALDLPIPGEYRQGVLENLERLMAQAVQVMDFKLDDSIEAAPIFTA